MKIKSFSDNWLPLLPLRDVVVFPYMVVPLFVGRAKSIAAVEEASSSDRLIVLSAQKRAMMDEPTPKDIHSFGTIGEVLQMLRLPDGAVKVLVEGLLRVRVEDWREDEKFFSVRVKEVEEEWTPSLELEALMRTIYNQFQEYVKLSRHLDPDILLSVNGVEDPSKLADIICANLQIKLSKKQKLLECIQPHRRLEEIGKILASENQILRIEKRIEGRVYRQLEKTQKEYYLHERLRAIQRELGKKDEHIKEFEELKQKIKKAGMSKEAEQKALRELGRLQYMPLLSQEGAVVRNYIDWMVSLPWSVQTKDKLDIEKAQKILEEEHFGLKKVKERVLEYLAVRKLVKDAKGPILCFVGPPGVGKTSVARSIAKAMGRKFVRISLGGVRDEAEIRGHRMTYVAALPGRIIQGLRKAGSKNPVFLMDEVDKMSVDFHGDPAAALLEVLDPEQNHQFCDHYLEVPFDLSRVMFITTANVLYSIPPSLRDRMEVIEFPSYTEEEKLSIARLFLLPKQLQNHGLNETQIRVSDEALLYMIRRYTREAGVRNLEREIATLCRKIARQVAKGEQRLFRITAKSLHHYLGVPKYKYGRKDEVDHVGIATGLACTEQGGDTITTEVVVLPGRGRLTLTGKLGEVMKESAEAALSYSRSRAESLGIEPNFYKKVDVHIHVPEGAIPKDGPSAGITMATALVSALTKKAVSKDVAMTGEITLSGRVLAVGGVKEKVLAAHRADIKCVILPDENKKDINEIPERIRRKMQLIFVKNMDDVLKVALRRCDG
jgi:ATP-dependent Lon protease